MGSTQIIKKLKLEEGPGTTVKDQIDVYDSKDVTFKDKIICWYPTSFVIMVTKPGET